jgi:hypothetical protein
MSEENIRSHLRAALNEVVSAEEALLREKFEEQDAISASREMIMKPVIQALESFKAEVGAFDWLEISLEAQCATIELMKTSSTSSHSFEISANAENAAFDVAEKYWCDIPDYCSVKDYEFSSAEEVLKFVVEALGKRIALQHVTIERIAAQHDDE